MVFVGAAVAGCRELTILPFNESYYSRDSDSDGTQVQTRDAWDEWTVYFYDEDKKQA